MQINITKWIVEYALHTQITAIAAVNPISYHCH